MSISTRQPNAKLAASKSTEQGKQILQATGRRKSSVASVRMQGGAGKIIINDKKLEVYFGRKTSCMIAKKPLEVTSNVDSFDINIKAIGGGNTGQAGAISLAIAKALLQYDETLRPVLRQAGLLTRDAREVERKKPGLHKARKAPQYSKR